MLQGGGDGSVHTEPSSERFSGESAHLAPVRKLRRAVVSSALTPSQPWDGHQLALGSLWPGHQPSSTEVRLQDHRSGAPGPAVGLWRGSGPGPVCTCPGSPHCSGCICQPREDPWSAQCSVGAELTHSCQQRWTLAAPGAMGRDRSPAPKPHGPWVQLGFQLRLCARTACWRLFPGTCQGRSP